MVKKSDIFLDIYRKCSGFFAKETCGFFSEEKHRVFALFVNNGEVFLFCDWRVINVSKNNLVVKRFTLFPLITKISITCNGLKFKCTQWSRDVDPFYMDDFFYYLKYQLNIRFEGFMEYWGQNKEQTETDHD